jgi:hypothetical protein
MILISLLVSLWKRFAGQREAGQAPTDSERDSVRRSYPGR